MQYLILDVETTGLPDFKKPADAPGQPRVCGVGLIHLDDNFSVEKKQAFIIKPDGWVIDPNSEATKVHGITQERAEAEGVEMREVARIYGNAIDERRIIVGFNVAFDLKLMRAELRFCGYPDRYLQTRHICTMQGCRQIVDARGVNGQKKAPRLEEACAHFGIDQGAGAHTGLGDAESAYEILLRLRDAGAVPEFVDPYDKTSGPKKAHRAHLDKKARPQGREYEQMVLDEQALTSQPDFLRGASEDGK